MEAAAPAPTPHVLEELVEAAKSIIEAGERVAVLEELLEDARGVEVPTKALEPPKKTQVLETIRIELGRHETRHRQRFVN